MADFGGFQVATPQEVLAKLQAQRDEFRKSQDPQVRRQGNLDAVLDVLFGNPQIQASQRITNALNTAQRQLEPIEGEEQLDTELRRLKAMRDAVEDLDPAVAAQINQRMLVIGSEKLEREKLKGDITRAVSKEAREEAAAARDAELHPEAVKEAKLRIQEKQAETVNYANPKTGEIQNVDALDSIAIKRLQAAGWVRVGLAVNADEPGKLGAATKPVLTDLQTNLLQSQEQLDMLSNVLRKFDSSYLKLGTQVTNFGRNWIEKFGGKLPPDQAGKLQGYTEFRRNSFDAFNRYIKFITGAQMSVAEAERIQRGFPDPEEDGPTVFLSKLKETTKQLMQVNKRARQALQFYPDGSYPQGDQWTKIQLPDVSDAEVGQFMAEVLGIQPDGTAQLPRTQPAGQTSGSSTLQDRIDGILKGR